MKHKVKAHPLHPKVRIIHFRKDLSKEQADALGDKILGLQRERQEHRERLHDLQYTTVINSHLSGKPVGVIVHEDDLEHVLEGI